MGDVILILVGLLCLEARGEDASDIARCSSLQIIDVSRFDWLECMDRAIDNDMFALALELRDVARSRIDSKHQN